MKKGTSFKKIVVCSTNDFDDHKNTRMKGWVEHQGGTFVKELNPSVTHLVASRKAWKRYHPIVKQARRMRTVNIVKYDWLENSLTRRPIRPLPVDSYLYEQAKLRSLKRTRKQGEATNKVEKSAGSSKKIVIPRDKRIELEGIEFNKAIEEFELDMHTVGFHPYSDRTGFVYVVALLRHDILKSCFDKYKIKVGYEHPSVPCDIVPGLYTRLHLFPAPEPFSIAPVLHTTVPSNAKAFSHIHLAEPWAQCLQLFESDRKPHTYACYTQFTRPGVRKQILVLAPPGSTWSFAWSMFEKFFKRKVGVNWTERPNDEVRINLDGENATELFQYQAPRTGEPQGLRETEISHDKAVVEVIETAVRGHEAARASGSISAMNAQLERVDDNQTSSDSNDTPILSITETSAYSAQPVDTTADLT